MKILLVNKFHWEKGGSEKYYFELGDLLKSYGHEIAYFTMSDEKNVRTGDLEYFVPAMDLNNGSKLSALNVIYNKKNGQLMEKALDEFKPDIVHLNNFQRQLSASIIPPIKKRNIPVVFTAHDFQAFCPAINMTDNDGNLCDLCLSGKYTNCVKKSCCKNSKLKSLLGVIEAWYYKSKKIYNKQIDFIITPSEFSKHKFIEHGVAANRIKAIHNSISIDEYSGIETSDEGYALYFGRLSREKGVIDLVNAFSQCNTGKLFIAGDGPEKDNIVALIKKLGLTDRVKMLGQLPHDKMLDVIGKARFVVVPSVCYENCSYVLLEALAIGKPVIGRNIGGIPELLKDDYNGFLFSTVNELAEKMQLLFSDDELTQHLAENAPNLPEELIVREKYYNEIYSVYAQLVQ